MIAVQESQSKKHNRYPKKISNFNEEPQYYNIKLANTNIEEKMNQ